MESRLTRLSSSAGLWIGAACWAISTELNYALVSWVCASGMRVTPWIAWGLALVALLGAGISARAFRHRRERLETLPPAGTPHEMLAVIGIAAGGLFTLIIAMQGIAGLFLTGCEP